MPITQATYHTCVLCVGYVNTDRGIAQLQTKNTYHYLSTYSIDNRESKENKRESFANSVKIAKKNLQAHILNSLATITRSICRAKNYIVHCHWRTIYIFIEISCFVQTVRGKNAGRMVCCETC